MKDPKNATNPNTDRKQVWTGTFRISVIIGIKVRPRNNLYWQ